MTTAIEPRADLAAVVESVIVQGDLSKLTPAERVNYYRATCESLSLNPLTKPFEYLHLSNKLVLYATKTCTDQLRTIHAISVVITSREFLDQAGLYVVTARATTKDGRTDEAIGAVNVKGLHGEPHATALMKAETKAKRRVTLSVAGLGWLDESEAASIPDASPVQVDVDTGEIAAISLSALRTMKLPPARPLGSKPNWSAFWAEARALGFNRERVHDVAGVASIVDFDQDALDDLLMVLRGESEG